MAHDQDSNAEIESELIASMGRLADTSASEVANIDLSSALLAQIEAERPRPWRIRLTLAAAIAAVLLGIWQWRSHGEVPRYAQIDAPEGAQLFYEHKAPQAVQGMNLSRELPFAITTASKERTDIRLPGARLRMTPNSHVELAKSGSLNLRSGIIEVDRSKTLRSPAAPITFGSLKTAILIPHGRAILEHHLRDTPMKLLKRQKIAAASAVAAVVVYSGYVTITKGDSSTKTVTAPKGAYFDSEGTAHTFDPQSPNGLTAAEELLAVAKTAANREESQEFAPSGASWSEKDQVVQFRIRGEAFDADSGQPIDGFSLKAISVASEDFAQTEPVQVRFHDLEEGRFVFGGLGLGTWRITASRDGYAPVIQTLEIADLSATPYLVIPLSTSGAQISGSVIDWRGRPVADAQVGLASCLSKDSAPKTGCNLATSDIHGRFVLDKLPEEEVFSLYAKHDRYGVATSKNLRSVPEEEGAGQHITIALSGVVRIYGRVMRGENKDPVANAKVAGAGGEVMTSASGDYELIVPLEETPDAYIVSYPGSSENLEIHSYPLNRSVRPLEWVDAQRYAAQVEIDFSIEMSKASLVGTIVDTSGRPLKGLELSMSNTNGWKHKRGHQTFPTKAHTDEQGNYRVDNIPAEAGYMMRYRTGEKDSWHDLGYVNVQEESEVRADFQIGSASIRGRYVNKETGEPMRVAYSARLGAEREGAKGVFTLAHSYPDGRFEIKNLIPGTYSLHSKTEWMDSSIKIEPQIVKIREGQILADIEVKIEGEGAHLWRFRILDSENQFLMGAYIRYQVGNANHTANLDIQDDGTAMQQLNDSIKEIFLEVPGYEPEPVTLEERDSSAVIEVHMRKLPASEEE